jgi:hypothetical protein
MTQLNKQIVSVLAAALLVVPQASVFAAEIVVSGNGSNSDNTVTFGQSSSTAVVQTNQAEVTNTVTSKSSTGENRANDNTGGDVIIRTGNAESETAIENMLNQNAASVDCCESVNDVEVKISGNGSRSENNVELGLEDSKQLFQTNTASVRNDVDSKAKTGENDAKRTTGGDVTIYTGDATAKSDVSTSANANQATIGGGSHSTSGTLSAWITGNGAYSINDLKLEVARETQLVQENAASVVNDVYSFGETGDNEANDNTGGEVHILTGDATAETIVDNMVNFNAADIDCGCVLDTMAKIADNGSDSENEIRAAIEDGRVVFQDGSAYLNNEADAKAETGENDAKYNTGSTEYNEDPAIYTGDATSTTEVANTSNMNVFGGGWEMPEVEVNFNWAHFVAFFGI